MDIYRHPGQLGPGGSQKYTMYPWISRDIPWMPCWFAVLYMYMYFGYTMYPWISRVVQWMPCWFALLYMFLNERREGRKKEASKVKQKNKAKQHSTPKAMYMYFGYTMYPWISRDVQWMPCWFVLLYMYMYMYFGYTMYPWISRVVQWMPCWFALLYMYMYMYFGYTLYPWISRDVPWMPCWFALLYMYIHVVVAELHGLCN